MQNIVTLCANGIVVQKKNIKKGKSRLQELLNILLTENIFNINIFRQQNNSHEYLVHRQ